jgi:hypothetical protein
MVPPAMDSKRVHVLRSFLGIPRRFTDSPRQRATQGSPSLIAERQPGSPRQRGSARRRPGWGPRNDDRGRVARISPRAAMLIARAAPERPPRRVGGPRKTTSGISPYSMATNDWLRVRLGRAAIDPSRERVAQVGVADDLLVALSRPTA